MTENRASPNLVYGILATLVLSIAGTMIWVARDDRPEPEAEIARSIELTPARINAAPEPATASPLAAKPAHRMREQIFEVKAEKVSPLREAGRLELGLEASEEGIATTAAVPAKAPRPIGPIEVVPERPTWSESVTITAPGGGFVRWGVNNWMRPPDALKTTGTVEAGGVFETPLGDADRIEIGPFALDQDITEVNFVLRRPDGSWGQNRSIRLEAKTAWSDRTRLGQGPVTVFSKAPGLVHYGINNWQSIQDKILEGPDPRGLYRAVLGELGPEVGSLEFAIKRADGSWDNNEGLDYRLAR